MIKELQIKLLSPNATLPTCAYHHSAGLDIYSAETLILEPQDKAVIKTDIAVNIPKGYVGLLTSRSGVSSKTHLVIETGKIDTGYTGNLGINIKNDTNTVSGYNIPAIFDITGELKSIDTVYQYGTYQINQGDKLAQLVIVPIETPVLKIVDDFHHETVRGTKGFGSSGFSNPKE